MRRAATILGHRRQTGTSIVEFVLVLPIVVAAIIFLLGFGKALLVREHGLVAARYAAFAVMYSGGTPDDSSVSKAVSSQGGHWTVAASPKSDLAELFGHQADFGSGLVSQVFRSVLNKIAGTGLIDARANFSSADLITFSGNREANSKFTLPVGTWTSDDCGFFLPILLDKVKLGVVSIF